MTFLEESELIQNLIDLNDKNKTFLLKNDDIIGLPEILGLNFSKTAKLAAALLHIAPKDLGWFILDNDGGKKKLLLKANNRLCVVSGIGSFLRFVERTQ